MGGKGAGQGRRPGEGERVGPSGDLVAAELGAGGFGLGGSPPQSLSRRHGPGFHAQDQHALLAGAGLPQRGDGGCRKGPAGVGAAVPRPPPTTAATTTTTAAAAAHADAHGRPGDVHPQQASLAGRGQGPPGVLGLGEGPGHQRVGQVGAALDASAALRLPVDLGHVLKVDEVAEAQRGQVQPGLLALVRGLDGDAHLRVVRRPAARVVLPLPQPALARRCVRVVEAAANRSKGPWGGREGG